MSQAPTAPITKSGTSVSSSGKKRGRPKGWKKADPLKGNSTFNENDPEVKAKISETVIDFATYTKEDAALDAELAQIAQQRPQVADTGGAAASPVVKAREHLEHLSAHSEGEYLPASTMTELQEQIHMAKQMGADSIDGTEALIKQIFRVDFEKIRDSIGYGIFHNIRVYLSGKFEGLKNIDAQTMEQRLHSTSKKETAKA